MDKEEMQKILEIMFDEGSLKKIIIELKDKSMIDEDVFEDSTNMKENIVKKIVELICQSKKDFRQKQTFMNGHNGVYPLVKAQYHMFEPEITSFTVNMNQVASNQINEHFDLGLFIKEDPSKPSMLAIIAEPRNCPAYMFAWFVE